MNTKKEIIEEFEKIVKDKNGFFEPDYEDLRCFVQDAYDAGYQAGILEGEKRMLDKAIERVPKESDLEGLYAEGWNTCARSTQGVLNALQALKNNL